MRGVVEQTFEWEEQTSHYMGRGDQVGGGPRGGSVSKGKGKKIEGEGVGGGGGRGEEEGDLPLESLLHFHGTGRVKPRSLSASLVWGRCRRTLNR